VKTKTQNKKFVVVRTYSAGVHCGFLESLEGTQLVLSEARRIWRWKGANTLNEVSLRGVDNEYSRISEPIDEITLTEAIEIIPAKPKATENLRKSRWGL
jgi:hypothetical protein